MSDSAEWLQPSDGFYLSSRATVLPDKQSEWVNPVDSYRTMYTQQQTDQRMGQFNSDREYIYVAKSVSDSHLRRGAGIEGDMSSLQYSRHARRLYVGGLPSSCNEEQLKAFLNEVINVCLGEDLSVNNILSVYMNTKKCFAFIELKSIELATACMELDGIMCMSNILRIQRANEYKPELVSNMQRAQIKLNLSRAPFPPDKSQLMSSAPTNSISVSSPSLSISQNKLIQRCHVSDIRHGNVVLIGYPYDEGDIRAGYKGGAAQAPTCIRHHLNTVFSQSANPEFGIDLSSNFRVLDIGDVAPGGDVEEALVRLEKTLTEVIRRGGLPVVMGGSSDVAYSCSSGLLSSMHSPATACVVNINSFLDVRSLSPNGKIYSNSSFRILLDDPRFCNPKQDVLSIPSCGHRLVYFGCQGVNCAMEDVYYVLQRDADIVWMSRDLKNISMSPDPAPYVPPVPVHMAFAKVLQKLPSNHNDTHVHFNMSAMSHSVAPGVSRRGASTGFSSDEIMAVMFTAGSSAKVAVLSMGNLNPEIEDDMSGLLAAEMIYNYLVGVKVRLSSSSARSSLGAVSGSAGTEASHSHSHSQYFHPWAEETLMSLSSPIRINQHNLATSINSIAEIPQMGMADMLPPPGISVSGMPSGRAASNSSLKQAAGNVMSSVGLGGGLGGGGQDNDIDSIVISRDQRYIGSKGF